MSDLIRREDVVKAMNEALAVGDISRVIANDILNNIPSADPERKWIPVSEALPEKKEMVLITNNKGHVKCGQYQGTFDDKNRWWWKHNTLEKVLAWMPLPEPWRGDR